SCPTTSTPALSIARFNLFSSLFQYAPYLMRSAGLNNFGRLGHKLLPASEIHFGPAGLRVRFRTAESCSTAILDTCHLERQKRCPLDRFFLMKSTTLSPTLSAVLSRMIVIPRRSASTHARSVPLYAQSRSRYRLRSINRP